MGIFGAVAALINITKVQLGLTCTCLVLLQTQPKTLGSGRAVVRSTPTWWTSHRHRGPGTHLVGVTELGHLVSMVKRLKEEGGGSQFISKAKTTEHLTPFVRYQPLWSLGPACIPPIIHLQHQATAALSSSSLALRA